MSRYESFLARKRAEYGDKFDPSDLDPRFIDAFNTGRRIALNTWGERKTGTVGVTTGWKPVFLLMARRNCIGSSWTLSPRDTFDPRQP